MNTPHIHTVAEVNEAREILRHAATFTPAMQEFLAEGIAAAQRIVDTTEAIITRNLGSLR
jgi:hypothetical protein